MYDSFYSVLLNRDGSLALAYIGYGSADADAVGELTLYEVAHSAPRCKLVIDLDVLGTDELRHERFPELMLTEDSIWIGTWGKAVVLELENGLVRGDVELGVDACVSQFALAAEGQWLWYLRDGQVEAVRVADTLVARALPAMPPAGRRKLTSTAWEPQQEFTNQPRLPWSETRCSFATMRGSCAARI